MKTTKVYCLKGLLTGIPIIATRETENAARPARIVWESDWRKHQRAMKFFRYVASGNYTMSYDELMRLAREIAGKDGAK